MLSANLQESIDWLKDNSELWDLVLNNWKATSKYCMDTHNDEITKRDVREEWVLYAHPSSGQLIDIDFESLEKPNIKMSFTSWSNFFQIMDLIADTLCLILKSMFHHVYLTENIRIFNLKCITVFAYIL